MSALTESGFAKVCPTCKEVVSSDDAFCCGDGARLEPTSDPYLGHAVASRYRLIARIGQGTSPFVYRARLIALEPLIAGPTMGTAAGRANIVRLFVTEPGASEGLGASETLEPVRRASQMALANVLPVTDFGVTEQFVYIVSPHTEAESLAVRLSHAEINWRDAVVVGIQVADAIGRAQALDLAPDLSVASILVARGSWKVLLNPFARRALLYEEDSEEVAIKRDEKNLVSLGVLLRAMLARSRPESVAPPDAGGSTPAWEARARLEKLVQRLGRGKPEHLPRDIFELAADLRRIADIASIPILPEPPPMDPISTSDELPTGYPALQPHPTLHELESVVERARKKGKIDVADRAFELTVRARGLISRFENVVRVVTDQQQLLDTAESEATRERARLQRAAGELVRDQANLLRHLDRLGHDRAKSTKAEHPKSERTLEVHVWKEALFATEEDYAHQAAQDLANQITALQMRMRERDREIDKQLLVLRAQLEGSLLASRVVSTELGALLNAASRMLATAHA